MKILQLCMFTNHWGKWFDVDSYDIVNGKDVLELSDNIGKGYDFILSAPPLYSIH